MSKLISWNEQSSQEQGIKTNELDVQKYATEVTSQYKTLKDLANLKWDGKIF